MECHNSTTFEETKLDPKIDLFEPFMFGELKIKNRIMMAAMTRCRSDNGVPNDIMAKYYTERAEDAGIVLTESIPISKIGCNYKGAGAGYTNEHMEGWKKVVDSVHKHNGIIFAQIYHCGRSATREDLDGETPLSCSSIKLRYGNKYEVPRELTITEIKSIIKEFANSAALLKEAGFDGVQLQGANGYLVDQFLRDATNQREDEYGGSIEKRSKFLIEVIDELIKVFGPNRTGIKLSPVGRYNDMYDSNPRELLEYLLPQLNERRICFMEITQAPDLYVENLYGVKGEDQIADIFGFSKSYLKDVILVGNNGLTEESAKKLIQEGKIDMVSFAKLYMANPDLVSRMKKGQTINNPDFEYSVTGGEKGYCDYPKHQ